MTRTTHKNNLIDLGVATNLSIVRDEGGPGTLILTLDDERANQHAFRMTDGSAREMWYGLTRIIHPLATGQLSSRREEGPGLATSLFTIFAARVRLCSDNRLIELDAVSAVNGFTARFASEEGKRLCTSLERIFSTAGNHDPDHQQHS